MQASRKKLEQLLTRPLGDLRLFAIVIDAKVFRGQHLVVALGIGCDGRKTVLGLRQGATENATVVKALLGDLQQRGIDFSIPRLYLLDGSKALRAAVRDYAGKAAFVQRCQVHKIRNVGGPPAGILSAVGALQDAAGVQNEGGRQSPRSSRSARAGADGAQSQRGALTGGRVGRDLDAASTPSGGDAAQDAVDHECDRIIVFDGGQALRPGEEVERGRSATALDGFGAVMGGNAMESSAWLPAKFRPCCSSCI